MDFGGRKAFLLQRWTRVGFQFAKNAGNAFEHFASVGDLQEHRARKFTHDVGAQNSQRGQSAGKHRQQDTAHFQTGSQRARVQAAGAAEGDQRVVARIVTAFHGNNADGFFHHRVGDRQNSFRELFDAAERSAQFLHSVCVRALTSSAKLPPSKPFSPKCPSTAWASVTVGASPRP